MTGDDPSTDEMIVPGLGGTTLADLIQLWTQRLTEATAPCPPPMRAATESYLDVFVRGGREAVKAWIERGAWIQAAVSRPSNDASACRLVGRVAQLVHELLSEESIENFFFMNKPPGMRLRFQATTAAPDLARRVESEVSAWRTEGLVDVDAYGVYEPELELFGGPRSMPYVHAIFTLDSLIWLEHHRHLRRPSAIDAWNVSFSVLRSLFEGMGIAGWEDLGVWSYVAERTGRRLPPSVATCPEFADLGSTVRAMWDRTGDRTDRLDTARPEGSMPATCTDAIRAAAARWKAGYFDRPDAWIGPRQAAAYVTIFHWNRAGLSAGQQALIAGALAGRRASHQAAYEDSAYGPG